MSDVLSTSDVVFPNENSIPASGSWRLVVPESASQRLKISQAIARSAALIALAFSPMSFGADPWFDRRRQATMSVTQPLAVRARRWISILDARRIALEILAEAEAERQRFAELEARQGVSAEFYS